MKHRKTIPLERPAMKTTLLIAIGLTALWGSGAQAAQITFGPSNQSITFTGNGANSVAVSSPTLTGSAFDTTNAFVGSFTLSAISPFLAIPIGRRARSDRSARSAYVPTIPHRCAPELRQLLQEIGPNR